MIDTATRRRALAGKKPRGALDTLLADDAFVISAGSAFLAARIDELTDDNDANGDAHRTGELLDRLFVAPLLMSAQ